MPTRRLSKLPPLIAAATIATVMGLTAAPPAHAQDIIVNLMSGQYSGQNGIECLQPLNGSLEGGVQIVQVTCNGSLAQQWTSAPAHKGKALSFTNRASGMCLDARGTSAAGTPIQQWPCAPGEGISNQFWNYIFSANANGANGNELASEVNPSPGSYCLTTAPPANGVVLQLCDGVEFRSFLCLIRRCRSLVHLDHIRWALLIFPR
jgi:Ricin-type beta-trefoil lectin domain-like